MIATQDLVAIRDAIAARRTSARATVDACLTRIADLDGTLHCFTQVFADSARERADEVDRAIAAGKSPGVLAGVPLAIKDNIVTRQGRTTCSSRMLENYRSPFDATVVEKLLASGAVIIGKTNLDEFAMGSSTENSAFGPTRNPWDPARVPGGSSGGSAAAVAAGMCCAALGSDTGGSIRQPAALCGCVGLKPSYGRVSRYGLVAFGSSLDQIGPLTRSVRDSALLLDVIAGPDERDSTSAPASASAGHAASTHPRIGIPCQYRKGNSAEVQAAMDAAIAALRSDGCAIVDVDLPLTDHGISTYYVIAPAEACANLSRFDGVRYGHRAKLGPGDDLFALYSKSRSEGFGPEVQRRIMLGTHVLSSGYYDAYYHRALAVRRLIKNEFDAAFAHCDAILGPTSPTVAFPLGGKADPLAMYLCDVYTVNCNIAGICGISVPSGFHREGNRQLPIGLQLQAPAFAEKSLLSVAARLEKLVSAPLGWAPGK